MPNQTEVNTLTRTAREEVMVKKKQHAYLVYIPLITTAATDWFDGEREKKIPAA